MKKEFAVNEVKNKTVECVASSGKSDLCSCSLEPSHTIGWHEAVEKAHGI